MSHKGSSDFQKRAAEYRRDMQRHWCSSVDIDDEVEALYQMQLSLEKYLERRNERTGEGWRIYKPVTLSEGLYFRAQIINHHKRMIPMYFGDGRWVQGSQSRILEG